MWNPGQDAWTTVRHGRRTRRPRDQGGRAGWRMDSAPPVPRRGRDQFPCPQRGRAQFSYPSQPVPPSVSARYLGPQSRSYAAVLGQNKPRQGPRFTAGDNRGLNQGVRQPTDPAFGQLVRKMHAIIKMVHHLQNVAPKPGKAEPYMISRMVEVLSAMIKPASPTPQTTDMIMGNAKNWGYNTLLILEEHYTAGLETLLSDLPKNLVPQWKTAFEVATKWARRNLPRITQDVIDHAAALITYSEGMDGDSDTQPQSPVPQNAPTEQTQVPQQTQRTVQNRTTRSTTVPQLTSTSHTVATMTAQARDWSPEHRVIDQSTEPSPEPPQQAPPRERRQQRRVVASNSCVVQGDDLRLEEEVDSPPSASIPDTTISKQENQVVQQTVAQVHQQPASPHDTSEGDISGGQTSTPKPYPFRVNRHMITERKMIDWGLVVRKKWLMIGDSNLSRIPEYSIPDLQIESYPGANFRHAQALMAKSTSHVMVEKVILSFGLNCRGQKVRETTIKQMQAAVRTATKRFPYAEVWIPIINHSISLTGGEQIALQILNDHIFRNMPFIPALTYTDFHTDGDHLHWTRETARAMLNHWVTYLNLDPL